MGANTDSFIRGTFVALVTNTALLGGILYCIWSQPVVTKQTAYEYAVESSSDSSLEFMLKERGKEGWQIVSARRAVGALGDGRYEFVFHRPAIERAKTFNSISDALPREILK